MKLTSFFTDFIKGLRVIFAKPQAGEGDRKLAKMSMIVMAQISAYGKHSVRTQVLKSIEGDLKRASKKGGKDAVDKMIENALGTPEYMKLLHRLDLNESHLRVMGMQALKNRGK